MTAEAPPTYTLAQARAVCRRVARAHYENFPVGRLGVPRERRRDIHAVYAFARIADDFADEPEYEGRRAELLDRWGARLETCVKEPSDHPVFLALGDTINRRGLPLDPFRDLLSAFRQDVDKPRYETWDELLDYCRRSANPVGRLVLAITGQGSPDALTMSDALCTALQLTNFWQDLSVDLKRGRCYIPRADAQAGFQVDVDALVRGAVQDGVPELLEELIDRTEALYEESQALPKALRGGLRVEIAATWLGGRAILAECEEMGPEVLTERPVLGVTDKALIALKAVTGRV